MLCVLLCASLFALCIFAGASGARSPSSLSSSSSSPHAEQRLAVFDDVWQTTFERYYDPLMGGVDWPALRTEFRPRAAEALTKEEFYGLLRRMLARLGDPHTRLYAPEEYFGWREPRYISVGVRVRLIEGAVVAVEVERGSEAARAGVRAGEEVLSVDGEAVETLLVRRASEQAGASSSSTSNSSGARASAAARIFEGERESVAEVVFRSEQGREIRVGLRRVQKTRAPVLRVRREGGYGVVEFNAFAPETAAGLARAMRGELRGVRGLVIDLRDNGGGEAEAMTDIASIFLPKGTKLGRFIDREGRAQLEPQTRSAMLSAADSVHVFDAPVVLLTSGRTASAAEVFVAALRESRRASTLGERTCGCVLGIRRRHTLPDGGVLEISEMDFRTQAGARLEGSGVVPDESLAPARRDISKGRDAALLRAFELLRSAGRPSKTGA
jgi:carboxyl-terminal processing protease